MKTKVVIGIAIGLILITAGCKKDKAQPDKANQNIYVAANDSLVDTDGYWVFETADAYGGYKPDMEYGLIRQELYKTFQNIDFEIEDTKIIYANSTDGTIEAGKEALSDFFRYKLCKDEPVDNIRAFFHKTFGTSLPDTLTIYQINGPEYPFNRMIVLSDKVLMYTYGSHFASFVKTEKEEIPEPEMKPRSTTTYSQSGYNTQSSADGSPTITVAYTFQSADPMHLELEFPDGINSIEVMDDGEVQNLDDTEASIDIK